jgi:hypothetical protein
MLATHAGIKYSGNTMTNAIALSPSETLLTFDAMLARLDEQEAYISAWREDEAAKRVKYARLIDLCIDGEIEPTDCPRCDETSLVHDDAGKRDICLECEYEVLESYYADCEKFADSLKQAAIESGRWPAAWSAATARIGPAIAETRTNQEEAA